MAAVRLSHPGAALAAACFAVLSVWRFTDGEPLWATLFAAVALAHLAPALRGGGGARVQAGADDPARRGWVRLAVANLALACAAVFWFPPLALVLAALGVYSAHRARVTHHDAPQPSS
ncbi:hypothetical protein [Pseudonocardia nigra]|uniref:hypothetical protein n=1 Tax=Pseudonocardia nigra TaxID=1921578 RepID=UPI001C5FCEF8|nr:hypothetical protein [Pseudonocardia nigra]